MTRPISRTGFRGLRRLAPLLLLWLVLPGCGEESYYSYRLGGSAAAANDAQVLAATVIRVLDGDTIEVLSPARRMVRVRLAGIDAPEKGQPFGSVAREELGKLVLQQAVEVEQRKFDRYGRAIAVVRRDGADVGLRMIERGLAWHYKAFEREQPVAERRSYAAAEAEARRGSIGLWSEPSPIPPWEQRRGKAANPGSAASDDPAWDGHVIANRSSRLYHLPSCPGYARVGERNRIRYPSEQAAQAAGFKRASGC